MKSKTVDRPVGVAEAGLLVAAREETVLAALELIADERRDEVDRRHGLDLRLVEPGVEDIRHAGQAELAECAVELDQIHEASPVLRSMRSR